MFIQGQLFAEDDTAFDIDPSAKRGEDRHGATKLEVVFSPGGASALIVDGLGGCRHEIVRYFTDGVCRHAGDFFGPFRSVLIVENVLPVFFKVIDVVFYKGFIIEMTGDNNVGQAQDEGQVRTRFDGYVGVGMHGGVGVTRIHHYQFGPSAAGSFENIHGVGCQDGFCPVGACHYDISGVLQIGLAIATQGQRETGNSALQTDGGMVQEIGAAEFVRHKCFIGMFS